ncbi:MAG: FHIPEP family type III secretion protein [Deltaproteobacteria bacterium]|nr:FHIPEP family type III secretion protein [Deltaproteobacteria bacterium]
MITKRTQLFADGMLAALVVSIVAMMIVPLPTPLLDALIVSNISISVLMLLVGMTIPNGLAFTAMPTLLLVTTLYRLALNISSTRLILLQAYAGRVIGSFGEFVVRGDYLVGAVIFLIITVVQYLVIARGSERVAEVGARFTLDSMPGKQMAIDADLRSGALNSDKAQERRRALQRESQFYGAMDGAMKFVKGDAIAGIFITAVNLFAGVAIGVGVRGMAVGDSLRLYGLLTVGDGLVSQIPSLLISTAAGVVVTRVASENEDRSLSKEVAAQLFGRPRVLGICALFLTLLAIVPGLPAVPFLVIAAFLALFAQAQIRLAKGSLGAGPGDSRRISSKADLPEVLPMAITLGPRLAKRMLAEQEDPDSLERSIRVLREKLFVELGVTLPEVRTAVSNRLEADAYELALRELTIGQGTIPPDNVLLIDPGGCRERPFESVEPGSVLQIGAGASWIARSDIDAVSRDGRIVLDGAAVLIRHLEIAIRDRAHELVGLQEVQTMLDQLEQSLPTLVRQVVPKPVSLVLLTDILGRLARERVSIRPLRDILEALSVRAPLESDPELLTELVRVRLSRYITHRYAARGVLNVHEIDPSIEEAVRDATRKGPNGSYLALPPDQARDIIRAVSRICSQSDVRQPQILLTQSDTRRFIRRLIEVELPQVVVMSRPELAPEVRVKPLDRVDIGLD